VLADAAADLDGGDARAAEGGGPVDGNAPPSGSCDALGRWQECDTDGIGDCATACRGRGLTCVESCCATSNGVTFELRAGGIWPSTVCAVPAAEGNSGIGCNYPLKATGALVMCCCR
jgi:hypothetical protein